MTDGSGLFSGYDQEYYGLCYGLAHSYCGRSLTVVVHVGFIDDGQPFVLPMIGKMGQYEDNPYAMYIHGIYPRHSTS